ncbi:MAG: VWA domain-containing protein, partial [Opitutaceae bacterium]
MSFAWPHLLWLTFVPLGLLVWELTHRRRQAATPAHPKILRAEAGTHSLTLVPRAAPSALASIARPWLWAGMICLIFAFARPQWGRIEEPVFDQSREILLAVDLSRSMLTPDIRPSRLDRAKLLIQSLLEKLAGERVGLVVFAGTGFLQVPLSADYEILREFLPALGPDFLPQGGSNYTALLRATVDAFGASRSADRFLIVLSDGEATDDDWRSLVDALKTKGVRVIGLGIGTAEGSMIPDAAGGFVKDERGAVVLSKLEPATLQELARETGGVYRDASTWIDLASLLQETVEAGRKGQFVEKNTIRLAERYQWPLAFGLWCMLVSLCYEFPIRPRPRTIALRLSGDRRQETGGRKATVAAALLAMFLSPVSSLLSPARAAATLAPPAPPSAAPSAPASSLSKMVGRLSARDVRSARDWADLGRETVIWGSGLQSEQQPVPEGPVRDALAAVDLGAKIDATTTDWPKLREELEALLKKPDDEKKDQPEEKNQQQQEPDKDQKNPDQQKQDREKQSQDQKQSDQKQPGSPNQNKSEQQPENQPFDQNTKPPQEEEPKPAESAFGDMKKDAPPPPPPGETQKVGGSPQEKDPPPPEAANPALAVPLQKLDQLRNQDSTARLFEMIEGEKKPAQKKSGK